MKHSIISELYTSNKVLSIIECKNEVIIEIETFSNNNGVQLNIETFNIKKEDLHSFIGTLLHVQQKMKGGKNG